MKIQEITESKQQLDENLIGTIGRGIANVLGRGARAGASAIPRAAPAGSTAANIGAGVGNAIKPLAVPGAAAGVALSVWNDVKDYGEQAIAALQDMSPELATKAGQIMRQYGVPAAVAVAVLWGGNKLLQAYLKNKELNVRDKEARTESKKQKEGSAGQLKGSDPMPKKMKAGTTKNISRDKLAGGM
jgi:hypothetical protein